MARGDPAKGEESGATEAEAGMYGLGLEADRPCVAGAE